MRSNKYFVNAARKFWIWYWSNLMDGFAPSDKNGNYKRPKGLQSANNLKINFDDIESLYLLLGHSCPWCHRALIITQLKNLSKIKKIFLKPNFSSGEWIFDEPFYDNKSLSDLYKKLHREKIFRSTVPLLVKNNSGNLELISNESSKIIKILNHLIQSEKHELIRVRDCQDSFLNKIHNEINNGVYKCGFARNQESYENASRELFTGLEDIDQLIKRNEGPWIFGEKFTYADIYLFPTIIRWELIYSKLFKCSEKEIKEFENIINWRMNFFQLKGIPDTCFDKHWIKDYYKGLFPLNPNLIAPLQPDLKVIMGQIKN